MSKIYKTECEELCKLFEKYCDGLEGDDCVSFYKRGVMDGINLALGKLGHAIYFNGLNAFINDVFDSDDYELDKNELAFASQLNKAEGWTFSDERIKKYVEVCRLCDVGDFEKASNMFGDDGEPLPKRMVEMKSAKGIKAYICERLEDANFHSEACLIEGCCYSGVYKLMGIDK